MVADLGGLALIDDSVLIKKAQNGDKESFGSLAVKYYKNIYNLAYRMTQSREEAKDVTQETFLRAYEALGTFDSKRPFLPWIYRIAWNLCADIGRKTLRTPREEPLQEETGILKEDDPNQPTQALLDKEMKEVLGEAINSLPIGYREPLIMFHLEGFSIKEIGQLVGMKDNVVKNRLYRARKMLRAILEEEFFNRGEK